MSNNFCYWLQGSINVFEPSTTAAAPSLIELALAAVIEPF